MNRYSYRAMTTDISELSSDVLLDQLNGIGAEGWKLVLSVTKERHGYSHEVHLLFMREDIGS